MEVNLTVRFEQVSNLWFATLRTTSALAKFQGSGKTRAQALQGLIHLLSGEVRKDRLCVDDLLAEHQSQAKGD
jgi:hypothetical protein